MNIIIRYLGLCDWAKTESCMVNFTKTRNLNTIDELWFLEHYPVFTYGLADKKHYTSNIQGIPVFRASRGGKITYHGPGQLIIYLLIDLKRKQIKFYELIKNIEIVVLRSLKDLEIEAHTKINWPGIYVKEKKICSLGLRIMKGCSLHGLSLNINMNLIPFNYIHPCGNQKISMTQIKKLKKNITTKIVQEIFVKNFCFFFNYTAIY